MKTADLAPVPPAPGASPQQVVDRITGTAKSSFSLGMKLLSRPRRQAMRAVYAFCRVVDDIADGELPLNEKRALLAEWREEIDRLYRGHPVSAIGQALLAPIRDYDLPRGEFLAMIEGMEMDAEGPIVAPTDAQLARYTRCVAGSVGLLSMRIFGAWKGEQSERFALALADALQLTNILRDVEEDAAIGRLYLPRETLEETGATTDATRIATDPALPDVCAVVGARARDWFETARDGIRQHERLAVAPALAMFGVYEAYLRQMETAGFQRDRPVAMSKKSKLYHGLRAVVTGGAA